MGTFSIWHWMIVLIFLFGIINLPAYWALKKAGWGGWWFLILTVPLAGLIFMWVFAFGKWPSESKPLPSE